MSMPSRSRTGSGPLIAGLLILIAIVVFVLVLLANNVTATDVWNSFFPVHNQVPATDRSLSTKSLYDFVFYIALVIFLLVEGLIIYSAFRFRRKPGDDELPPQTHGNNLVEIVWTLIPTVIVGILFVLSWQTLNVVDATVKTDVHVRAVAARFQWSFEYLDGTAPDAPVLFEQVIPTGADGGSPCRSACRSRSTSARRTSSTRSTCRCSCSSGTSCRGSSTRSTSRSTTRARTAASVRSCAAPATRRCCST